MPVYMLRAGRDGPVKIGKAINPVRRIAALQGAHWEDLRLIRLLRGGLAEEASLHRKFASLHIAREWFRFSPDMLGDLGLEPVTLQEVQDEILDAWKAVPDGYDRKLWRQCLNVFAQGLADDGETPMDIYTRAVGHNGGSNG